MCALEHRGADGDQAALLDCGAEDLGVVPERSPRPDARRVTRRALDDAVVLDVGLWSELDGRRLAAQDGAVKHAGLGGHAHVADEHGAGGDIRVNGSVSRMGPPRAFHSGFRFSMKAVTPSRKSSDM